MDFVRLDGILCCLVFFALYYAFKVGLPGLFKKYDNLIISLFSFGIYGVWYPPGILLVLFFSVMSFWFSNLSQKHQKNRVLLGTLICISLAILFVFKYSNWFIGNVFKGVEGWHHNLILPVGISFYVFTMIGYLVDIAQSRTKPVKGFTENALIINFWPALAAGPILRSQDFVKNLVKKYPIDRHKIFTALMILILGFSKKIFIADNLGAYVNKNLSLGITNMNGIEALITLLGFSGQIYADFSGYSDMAIGFSLLLGFHLPANFNYPYRALSVADFWRRWHISLSTWFRDYIYIPLGGSRAGIYRTYFSIMTVFIISGIWHGAGLNFIVWGFLHGIALVAERVFRKQHSALPNWIRYVITFGVVQVCWAFFRLDHMNALKLIKRIVIFKGVRNFSFDSQFYMLPILGLLIAVVWDHIAQVYFVDRDGYPSVKPSMRTIFTACVFLLLACFLAGKPLGYIYFEF